MPVDNLRAKAVGLVVFAVFAIAAFSIFVVKSGVRAPLTKKPYEVNMVLPDAASLVRNADVRSAGVIVGHVEEVKPTRNGAARVKVTLDKDFAPLANDARVRIRLKTVLGESYVSIVPGTGRSGTIPDGGWMSAGSVDDQVQLDQILDVFDTATRGRLRDDILRLGGGLDGRGVNLNRAFAGLEATAVDGAPVTHILAAQHRQLVSVIRNTSGLFDALASRRAALQGLVRGLDRTARAAQSRDRALAATVHRLPGTLRSIRAAANGLGTFGTAATPVLANLAADAATLTPAVHDLRPAARSTQDLLQRLPALTRRADPLLTELRGFSAKAPELTTALPKLLCEINPALDYLAPYHRDLGGFLGNVAMVTDASDEIGRNPITVLPTVDARSLRFKDSVAEKTAEKLIDMFGFPLYHPMRYNPYPKPNTVATPQPWDGKVPVVHSTCR